MPIGGRVDGRDGWGGIIRCWIWSIVSRGSDGAVGLMLTFPAAAGGFAPVMGHGAGVDQSECGLKMLAPLLPLPFLPRTPMVVSTHREVWSSVEWRISSSATLTA